MSFFDQKKKKRTECLFFFFLPADFDSLGTYILFVSFLQFRGRWYDFPFHGVKGVVAGVIVGEIEQSRVFAFSQTSAPVITSFTISDMGYYF